MSGMWVWLLVLRTAWALDVAAPAVEPVHPLLLGPTAEAVSPVLQNVALHAAQLATLDAPQAEAYIKEASAAGPLDRLSAQALTPLLQDRQTLQALSQAGPEQAAALVPSLGAYFDGSRPATDLGLDGLSFGRSGLKDGKEKVPPLGQGEFGVVYPHPKVPGAVIKAVEHSFEVSLMTNATPRQTAEEEEETARALAKADAGPRYFGRTALDRRQVSVRERVYGQTMQSLADRRAFGPEEKELVMDLLRRLAKARLVPSDMRAPNIMIGRTAVDPRRRAYLVDGGTLESAPEGRTEEQVLESLYRKDTVINMRWDPYVGQIVAYKPFSRIVAEGLERAAQRTAWQRFKGLLKSIGSAYSRIPPRY